MAWTDAVFTIRKLKKKIDDLAESLPCWTVVSSNDVLKTFINSSTTTQENPGRLIATFKAKTDGVVKLHAEAKRANTSGVITFELYTSADNFAAATTIWNITSTTTTEETTNLAIEEGVTYKIYFKTANAAHSGTCTEFSVRGTLQKKTLQDNIFI